MAVVERPASVERPALGLWVYPSGPVNRVVDAVVAAEDAGFDEIWLGDEGVHAAEPFAVLAAAARHTSRIALGIGIVPLLTRHPVAVAVSALTLHELSGGRARLGMGVGGGLSLDPPRLNVDKPLAQLRAAVHIVKAVADGCSTEGFTAPDGQPKRARPPIYIGSRGPLINRMASETCEGAFISGAEDEAAVAIAAQARSVRPIAVVLHQAAPDRDGLGAAAERLRRCQSLVHATSIGLAVGGLSPLATVLAVRDALAETFGAVR